MDFEFSIHCALVQQPTTQHGGYVVKYRVDFVKIKIISSHFENAVELNDDTFRFFLKLKSHVTQSSQSVDKKPCLLP